MSVNITKTNTNEYIVVDENNQTRVVTFASATYADDNIMDIIYRDIQLDEIEGKICKLEKDLDKVCNNSRLAKKIKEEMNLLIRKYELLEHDLYLIKQEFGFNDYIQNNDLSLSK